MIDLAIWWRTHGEARALKKMMVAIALLSCYRQIVLDQWARKYFCLFLVVESIGHGWYVTPAGSCSELSPGTRAIITSERVSPQGSVNSVTPGPSRVTLKGTGQMRKWHPVSGGHPRHPKWERWQLPSWHHEMMTTAIKHHEMMTTAIKHHEMMTAINIMRWWLP